MFPPSILHSSYSVSVSVFYNDCSRVLHVMAKRRRKSVVKNVSPSSSPSLSSDPAEVTEEEEKQHKKIKIEDLPLSSSSPSIDSNTSSTVELISHDTHTPIDTSTSNFIQVFNSRDVAWKVKTQTYYYLIYTENISDN